MDQKKPLSGRLGTQMRGKIAAQYEQRGHQRTSLWYTYSPKSNKDIVLSGHLMYSHFVLMEADPKVKEVNYSPEPTDIWLSNGQPPHQLEIHAVVTCRNSKIEWHRVMALVGSQNKQEFLESSSYTTVANAHGAVYVPWCEQDFIQYSQRIANWRRVLAWLSVIRDRSVSRFETDLAVLIHSRSTISIREIADFAPKKEFPLYLAAAFHQVQLGQLYSNLDDAPLSYSTILFKKMGEE